MSAVDEAGPFVLAVLRRALEVPAGHRGPRVDVDLAVDAIPPTQFRQVRGRIVRAHDDYRAAGFADDVVQVVVGDLDPVRRNVVFTFAAQAIEARYRVLRDAGHFTPTDAPSKFANHGAEYR